MTTLEKIRAEIEQHKNDKFNCIGVNDVLKIIDRYAEQEPKWIIEKNGWHIIPKCHTCKYLKNGIVPCNRCKDNSEFKPQERSNKE